MRITQLSGLARPLDFSYRSNRTVAILSFAVLLLGLAYHWYLGFDFPEMLWWAFQTNLSVFLAWAMGRELDPDHNATAFVAIPFSLLSFLWYGSADWLLLLLILLLLRLGSHICGSSAKLPDALLLLGLSTYLSWQGHYLTGIMAALVFFINSRLPPSHENSRWYALSALLLGIASAVLSENYIYTYHFEWPWLLGASLVSLVFLSLVREYRRPRSSEDYRVKPLNGQRMQTVLLIMLFGTFLMFLLRGKEAIITLAPFWSAVLAAALVKIYRTLSGRSLA
ncbi:MAG: hypothetical protein ACLFUB_01930 [Cyclobacteriaceae bacterium]